MAKIKLTCGNPECRHVFALTAPEKPGPYQVLCPKCHTKSKFVIPTPKQEIKLGWLDDGNYRIQCSNPECHQHIIIKAEYLMPGDNEIKCPKCSTKTKFEIEPTEEMMLRCKTADCGGHVVRPDGDDGIFESECDKCGTQYKVQVQQGNVIRVSALTKKVVPTSIKHTPMKLVTGIIKKREYKLEKGIHYIGRANPTIPSDFMVDDKYASSRSIRIDVNGDGLRLIYKMTVEKATNPVYHNGKKLIEGDITYLNYDDIIKIGQTTIKVKRCK